MHAKVHPEFALKVGRRFAGKLLHLESGFEMAQG
jgi:hypothetical protein